MKAISIVVFLSVLSVSFGQSCLYTAPDGTAYNLTSARNTVEDYTFDDVAAQVTYFINFCGETIVPCNASGACMEPFFSIDSYSSLGLYSTQNFLDIPDDGWAGLTLQFSEGSACPEVPGATRNITVNVKCAYGEPTTFVSANQDMDCSFTAYFTSAAACPSKCPEGKKGATCNTCLEGYFGPNCMPCTCQFGACSPTNGSCACEPGWSGATCNTCSPSRCVFNETNNFLYDLTPLANPNTDYTYVSVQEYYVNILANTNNACGGLNTPVCMRNPDNTYMSLGSLATETIMSEGSSGVIINYAGGSACGNGTASVSVVINCIAGAVTEIDWAQQTSPCVYSIEIKSGLVCPGCTPGYFGEDCSACGCVIADSCNDGLDGNGTCNCKDGATGQFCGACDPGFYGSDCKACSCELNNSVCKDGINGTGSCTCFDGFSGDNCENKKAISDWGYAGIGLAVGVVVGVLAAVGICMFRNSKKRDYDAVKG